MTRCEIHLERAEKLKVLLADEGERWRETVLKIDDDLITIVGDAFIASAFISYLGPFTGSYRSEIIKYWCEQTREKEIPISEDFELIKTLGMPILLRDWTLKGLPSDNLSQENSILAT
mmetsp:Transcript_28798/g.26016  ORF Transcript_28798/g.26016 Transcript_28798/m.26016 type:complete len:118 (-) Transcript_28798:1850-2203(-)